MAGAIRRIGIICEGSTDFVVLRTIATAVIGGEVYTQLQPDFDKLRLRVPGQPGPGWQGVRKFLKQSSVALAMGLFDLVIVQIDADVGDLEEIEALLAGEEQDDPESLDALCRHVKGWIHERALPLVIVVLPRSRTEAWLVAVQTKKKSVESLPDPDQVLADAGLLSIENGRPRKEAANYARLAAPLPKLLGERGLESRVPELARFRDKLLQFQQRLRKAG